MRRSLPERSHSEVIDAFPQLRQSLLGAFDNCRLMTLFDLTGHPYTNAVQARGILFHRFAAEFLRTLWQTGNTTMPIAEALEILYEVCAQRDVPPEDVVTCKAGQRRLLRIAAVVFARDNEFRMHRLISVEEQLRTTVEYPHPVTGATVRREVTGRPDAIVAEPPDGVVVLDWKTTLKAPPKYEGSQEETDAGVSYMGYFQQRKYALLVMHKMPNVQRVTLREFYVLDPDDPVRKATVTRAQLEHVEREIAGLAENLDRALMAGAKSPLWHPSPGHHCVYCPRPTSCPIDPEERAIQGGVTSMAQAERMAGEYVVAKRVYKSHHEAMKPIVAEHGPIPVKSGKGRYVVRWKQNKKGTGRTFGVFVPEQSDRGPDDPDLAAAFEAAAERRRAA